MSRFFYLHFSPDIFAYCYCFSELIMCLFAYTPKERGCLTMKTFQEIADELGVSKQAVYKRYRDKLHKAVSPYARVVGGTTYIMEQGVSVIKQSFLEDNAHTKAHTNRIQDTLISMLQKELKAKNRHIAELGDIIRAQVKTINTLAKSKSKGRKKPLKKGEMSAPIKRHMQRKKFSHRLCNLCHPSKPR